MRPEHEREFREFVTARSADLLRTAYYLTGDAHRAQDLLQTALLSCARRWSRIRSWDQPMGYVRKAMFRHQINWWRVRRNRLEVSTGHIPDHGHDPVSAWVIRDDLMTALRQLPPRQRAVVLLRYYEDRPESDVARILGVSIGTVRSQAAKALAKLRTRHGELVLTEDG
ncbi:SigE family RNA polymerase sigma factor [Phytomonospora sp. NPDC050363]|uniref:SigE family RNA polymerase sigma factor n=1 Tax=Phytomonospora sp. NPDC050363 TaxID=3155642 RepID=UPI0033C7CAAA